MSALNDKEVRHITRTSQSLVNLRFAETLLDDFKRDPDFSWDRFPDMMTEHCRTEIDGYFVIGDWPEAKIEAMRDLAASEGRNHADEITKDIGELN